MDEEKGQREKYAQRGIWIFQTWACFWHVLGVYICLQGLCCSCCNINYLKLENIFSTSVIAQVQNKTSVLILLFHSQNTQTLLSVFSEWRSTVWGSGHQHCSQHCHTYFPAFLHPSSEQGKVRSSRERATIFVSLHWTSDVFFFLVRLGLGTLHVARSSSAEQCRLKSWGMQTPTAPPHRVSGCADKATRNSHQTGSRQRNGTLHVGVRWMLNFLFF